MCEPPWSACVLFPERNRAARHLPRRWHSAPSRSRPLGSQSITPARQSACFPPHSARESSFRTGQGTYQDGGRHEIYLCPGHSPCRQQAALRAIRATVRPLILHEVPYPNFPSPAEGSSSDSCYLIHTLDETVNRIAEYCRGHCGATKLGIPILLHVGAPNLGRRTISTIFYHGQVFLRCVGGQPQGPPCGSGVISASASNELFSANIAPVHSMQDVVVIEGFSRRLGPQHRACFPSYAVTCDLSIVSISLAQKHRHMFRQQIPKIASNQKTETYLNRPFRCPCPASSPSVLMPSALFISAVQRLPRDGCELY